MVAVEHHDDELRSMGTVERVDAQHRHAAEVVEQRRLAQLRSEIDHARVELRAWVEDDRSEA